MRLPALTLATVLLATPVLATDFQALRDDPKISTGLRWIAAADAIRNNCARIEERTWTARTTALGLLNRAFDLGYSLSEATEYVDDEAEQARVHADSIRAAAPLNGQLIDQGQDGGVPLCHTALSAA